MIDEGMKLLAEGVAQRASDIDVVWLHGHGWPTWTGGPMFHAHQTGIAEVCRRLEAIGVTPSDALDICDNAFRNDSHSALRGYLMN